MKTTIITIAVSCAVANLFAQAPNASPAAPLPPAQKQNTGAPKTVGKPIQLLDPNERENWKESLGEWKFDGAVLTGTGASGIVYNRAFKTPFQITFGFEMLEGTRPAVSGFGRYSLMTEGVGKTLAIHPMVPKAGGFNYDLKRKYRVKIDITPEKLEVRINNRLIDTRKPGMTEVPPLRFSAGDGYSPGIARFSDIEITAQPKE
jgi:hypothetical protein